MPSDVSKSRSWWKLVLTGLLAFAFGLAAILLPARIMFERILDVIFGGAKRYSGGMTAVAALLALVALVAIDGLLNLFGSGVMENKVGARIRGVVGVAVAAAAILWPGITAYVAVQLIGFWAVLIGILELVLAKRRGKQAKDRGLTILSALAFIAIGVCMMKWVFTGAVLVSSVVGVAALARGIGLIASGIHERAEQAKLSEAGQIGRASG
jgi:uncharacterized membrane protein HdeD (DUF308 family)